MKSVKNLSQTGILIQKYCEILIQKYCEILSVWNFPIMKLNVTSLWQGYGGGGGGTAGSGSPGVTIVEIIGA